MEEISRTFFRIRRIEGVDRDYSSQMKEQIKMAVAQEYVAVLRAEQTLQMARSHECSLARSLYGDGRG